ncbi:helix-turn-helix domain-containing protein [Streptomyces sp. NPDC012466]|jgi:DNA-binding XRE family transcriptional regulator|uniref:helix-turn-helix domain-containing protein n=1 Tax=Streptomyces sp. NPDC012466 TaxID=3364835 RepID=UPI0036E0BAA9
MSAQAPTFGEELRRRRNESGKSLTDMERLVHATRSHLSKIERGHRNPSIELARACDAKLRADGQLLALLPAAARTREERPASRDGVPWSLSVSVAGESTFTACDPKALADGHASSAMAHWVVAPGCREAASMEVSLPVFHAVFEEYRRLGQCSGPALVIPLSSTATGALRGLAHSTAPASRAAVLRLAARFAEYTGWMWQEADDDRAARWWTEQAAHLAASCGDHEMAAYSLLRQAELALYQGDAQTTVDLAEAAGRQARGLRTRGLAAQREAQGYALMGSETQCRRALDRAAGLVDSARTSTDDGPALGGTHLPDLAAFVAAWCLRELGESDAAVTLLDSGRDTIAPHALRARARHGARLALALADADEVDRACTVARSVAQDVQTTDSATVRADLRQLRSSLATRRKHPAVRDILPVIATSLRGARTS